MRGLPLLLAGPLKGAAIFALLATLIVGSQGALAQDETPTVVLAPNPDYGVVLADPYGWSLYVPAPGQSGDNPCEQGCGDTWVPYTIDSTPVAPPDLPGTLDVVESEDGTWQVTFDGMPLFYFAGDANPGDVNGDGLQGFVVTSWVLPTTATTAPEPPVAVAPPPTAPTVPPELSAIPAPPSAQAPEPPSPAISGAPGSALLPPPLPPPAALPAPSAVAVVAPPNGSVVLSWLPTPSAQSYRIYQTTNAAPLNLSLVQTVSQTTATPATSATVTGLAPGQQYLFQVRAVDPLGQETPTPTTAQVAPTFGSAPLAAPSGLAATNASGTSLTLTWAPVPGATNYVVLQSVSPGGPLAPAPTGPVLGTTATITGLTPGAPYAFQVVALDTNGNQSPPSNTVTTSSGSIVPAPTSLSSTASTATSVTLTWAAVPGAATYRVKGSRSLTGPFLGLPPANVVFSGLNSGSAVGNAGATRPTATITGLTPGTSYFFQVFAVDSAGNESAPSNTANGLTATQ